MLREICQTKRHPYEYIMDISSVRDLGYIFFSNPKMMIPLLEIKLREQAGKLQLTEQLIDEWEQIFVLDREAI